MKKITTIIEANIKNLTGLWKTAGAPFQSYHKNNDFEYCKIQNSDWPNKLWFNLDITEDSIEKAIQKIIQSNSNLVIPYWDIYESKSYEIIEAKGFVKKSEQVAMALKLAEPFEQQNSLDYKLVSNKQEAKVWADLYPNAFGYVISEEILVNTYKDVQYYLVYFQSQPIGTFMLFHTENILGIHGVGVIPEMRRKGFAEEIMKFALNRAIDFNAEYATLQASVMGKDLYTKLGFEDLFVIKNYVLEADKK